MMGRTATQCLILLLALQQLVAQEGGQRNLFTGNYDVDFLKAHIAGRKEWHPLPTIGEPSQWDRFGPAVARAFIEKGETRLDYSWPVIPATAALDFVRNGNRTNYENTSFERRHALADLVMAELFERRGRFTDQIVNGIWAICEETYWGISAHVGMQEQGPGLPDVTEPTVDLFAAETGSLLAWTVYLLGPRLDEVSPLVRERVEYEIRRRILVPNRKRRDFWWMGFTGRELNNWTPWICSNWITAILLVEDEPQARADDLYKAMVVLDNYLGPYPADGGCDEGPGYWNKAAGSLFDCLCLLYSASGGDKDDPIGWGQPDRLSEGSINLFDRPLIREMGRFICRAYISYPYCINFADASALLGAEPCLVYRYGKMTDDTQMKGFAAFLARQDGTLDGIPEPGFGLLGMRQIPALFVLDELRKQKPEEPLVPDVWLPDLQVMAARSFPGTTKGLYFAAKGGNNGESHNHNDVGNFIVCLDGLPAIIDIGVGTYTAKTFSAHRYEIWTMQSSYHNLPEVNGVMQQNGRGFAAGKVAFQPDDSTVSFGLDMAGAYPDAAQLESLRRNFRLDRGKGLIIRDAYTFRKKGNDIVMNLMTDFEATPDPEHNLIRFRKGEKELVLSVDPQYSEIKTERIPISDPRLHRVWGDELTRIRLRATTAGNGTVLSLKFRR